MVASLASNESTWARKAGSWWSSRIALQALSGYATDSSLLGPAMRFRFRQSFGLFSVASGRAGMFPSWQL